MRIALILARLKSLNLHKQKTMNTTKIKWTVGILAVIGIAILGYLLLQPNAMTNGLMIFMMLLVGLLLGGLMAFLFFRNTQSETAVVKESSHTIAESMRKVFKIVSAEGHFNEIYNYEETTKLFRFIPSTKKALVIVEAKVLVGYDFEKLQWEIDEINQKVRLKSFPAPEILSTETEYKYYNIEEQFFNLFSKDDLAKIQKNSKEQVIEAAKNSHLPEVAAEQMKTLLTELLASKNFALENTNVIQKAIES